MSNLQDHSTSNPTSIAQAATVAALEGTQEPLKIMTEEFKKRRDAMVGKVNSIRGLSVKRPDGAFYCFVGFKDLIGKTAGGKKIDGSMTFTELLLTQANVAVVPGNVFGDDAYIRLSYATSMKNIDEGLKRIENFIKTAN
jgi:aspartate aminotransferase